MRQTTMEQGKQEDCMDFSINKLKQKTVTIAESLRREALDWWHELDQPTKMGYSVSFFHRMPESLTGREVEQLYRHFNYID